VNNEVGDFISTGDFIAVVDMMFVNNITTECQIGAVVREMVIHK
jgi:hypothetical protein